MLDAITGAPAAVQNGRLDILATNALARGLFSEMYVDPVRPVNHARFVFLSPRAQRLLRRLGARRDDTVAILRTAAGRIHTTAICRILSASSRPAARSSAPDGPRTTCASTGPGQDVHHPVVGDLSLTYEMMDLSAESGLTILTYTAEPGSKSAEALDLLGSWAATLDEAEAAETPERA